MNRLARLALVAAAFASATALSVTAARATEKVPLGRTLGAPTITPSTGPTYYLWSDDAGWHLRWVGRGPGAPDKKTAFTGILNVTNGRIAIIKPAGMAGGDDTLNRLDRTRAMFKSECTDAVEGLDFKVEKGATSLYLELFVDYDVIAPGTVRLGKDAVSPADISPMLQIDLSAPATP